ncbi:MAG: BPSL0067 family protein [Polyangiaceae bacterium]|nr:BPSL0067 family protein [Polyangiaceae bacterium]
MPYICQNPELFEGKKIGSGQCVAFVQQCAGAPSTSVWQQGELVKSSSTISKGTAIATFENGHYPNRSSGNHAAIYVSHDDQGITVWDQWSGQTVHQRKIRYKGGEGSASNDGDQFYVIE